MLASDIMAMICFMRKNVVAPRNEVIPVRVSVMGGILAKLNCASLDGRF